MRILHLYPNLMNLYGDYGNIKIIYSCLKDMGIRVDLDRKEIQDNINILQYDFIYMGSGTEKKQLIALNDLMKYSQYLKMYIESGKTMLLTGNAMELMAKKIDQTDALGFIDFNVQSTDKRYTGDVIAYNETLKETVGFINRSTIIEGGKDDRLFDYIYKDSDLRDQEFEGYRYHNLFGTHLIGPVLVKNPQFLKEILKLIASDKYKEKEYSLQEKAFQNTLEELKKRK